MNPFERTTGRGPDLPYHGGFKSETVVSGSLKNEDKEKARAWMKKKRRENSGEQKEIGEEREDVIEDCNRILQEEFRILGIGEYFERTAAGKIFDGTGLDHEAAGDYNLLDDVIRLPYKETAEMLAVCMHELVHRLGAIKVRAENLPATKTQGIEVYRAGYRITIETLGGTEELQNNGLNEGVVQLIAKGALERHAKELASKYYPKDLAESKDKENGMDKIEDALINHRRSDMDLVLFLIGRIAHSSRRPEWRVLEEFKRGQFTGNMMHLRRIEDVFGTGALDVLAEYGRKYQTVTYTSDIGWTYKDCRAVNHDRFMDFFHASGTEEQDRIAKQILSKEGFERYSRRRRQTVERSNRSPEETRAPASVATPAEPPMPMGVVPRNSEVAETKSPEESLLRKMLRRLGGK